MTVSATSQAPAINKPHLKPKTLGGYGLGGTSCNTAFQMTSLFLRLVSTNVVGIRASHAGVILVIAKVRGAFADLFAGRLMDHSRLASARMVDSGATILWLSLFLAPRIKGARNLAATFLITAMAFVVIGALTIYLSTYVLTRYSEAGRVAIISIVITTGAVLYVGPFGPTVTRVLGKKRGFMYAAVVAAAGGVLFSLSNFLWYSFALSLLGLFFMGVGMGILNTMTWALEADTGEYGEYKTGIRTEGATYSEFSFTRKVGQAVGVAVAGYVLTWAGFNPDNTVQSEDAIRGMALGAGLVPAVIFLGAMLIMTAYPLTEAKFKDIMKAIEGNRQLRHEQLEHGDIPSSVPTREDRVGPTARDSHPMTTQSPVVPPKNDDDAPSA